jgi:hypothetical protein
MFQIPKLNYCEMRRRSSLIPIVSTLMEETLKYGNIGQQCPLKPGNHFVKDYPIDRFPLVSIFAIGSYAASAYFSDENGKAITFWRFELNFRRL